MACSDTPYIAGLGYESVWLTNLAEQSGLVAKSGPCCCCQVSDEPSLRWWSHLLLPVHFGCRCHGQLPVSTSSAALQDVLHVGKDWLQPRCDRARVSLEAGIKKKGRKVESVASTAGPSRCWLGPSIACSSLDQRQTTMGSWVGPA
jgi:hypothetical protein